MTSPPLGEGGPLAVGEESRLRTNKKLSPDASSVCFAATFPPGKACYAKLSFSSIIPVGRGLAPAALNVILHFKYLDFVFITAGGVPRPTVHHSLPFNPCFLVQAKGRGLLCNPHCLTTAPQLRLLAVPVFAPSS